MQKPIRVVILGAGDRGRTYAAYAAAHPDRVQIVGVADINPKTAQAVAKLYNLPPEAVWGDWSEAVAAKPDCDLMMVTMPDALHIEPAIACLDAGYHLLLEKPMGRTWEECERLAAKVHEKGDRLVILGHVLRYTVYFKKLKELLDQKAIGETVSIQHLEPVAYMHAAHSFCRGNWGNTERATPMILQKCCHDFDQFVWWLNKRCTGVSSFGNTFHFNAAHRPAGAADRCLSCPAEVERACPYSARKIYLERQDYRYPFVDKSDEAMKAMLQDGPYGRCVYACDNDAVDHQVVNLRFEGGVTVAHQMESYTYTGGRETKVFGTRGEIVGDGRKLTIYHFDTRTTEVWDSVLEAGAVQGSGHGGGDFGLMDELVYQLTEGDPKRYMDIFDVSLESHRIAFAAEASRRANGALMLAD
ncbi:MAG: Gfo/Idh/MocA family oxidoreductase [Kiritimatiellae bacterium]|nr:Gfo/Idh/MocA family oxidoreductase [Kiritimatiellia bacterium]MBR5588196.1 Gfo/Idh/MocA family oxidoreductase [Kiritimatiellia bacterium]